MRQAFDKIDSNDDGCIEVVELETLVGELGWGSEKAAECLAFLDKDKNGVGLLGPPISSF